MSTDPAFRPGSGPEPQGVPYGTPPQRMPPNVVPPHQMGPYGPPPEWLVYQQRAAAAAERTKRNTTILVWAFVGIPAGVFTVYKRYRNAF